MNLKQKIENREAVVGIIGLGYVDLPLAVVFAEAGFRVVASTYKGNVLNWSIAAVS